MARRRKNNLTASDIDFILFIVLMPVMALIGLLKIYRKIKILSEERTAKLYEVDQMSGLEFEHYMAHVFRRKGYRVQVTPASGDYGADLLLEDGNGLTVVQLKCYSKKVNLKAVQEVIGAKSYYKANHCMVVTNNYYQESAINLAKSANVVLWDRNILRSELMALHKSEQPKNSSRLKLEKSYIISSLVLCVVAILVIVFSVLLATSSPSTPVVTTNARATTAVTNEATATSVSHRTYRITVHDATADSTYTSRNGNDYSIAMTIDRKNTTCWQNGSENDGIGDSLTYTITHCYLERIDIVNGNRTRENSYKENNRLSQITVSLYLDGELVHEQQASLADNEDELTTSIQINESVECDTVTLTINEVYKGTTYSDTGITEISFYGDIIR